VGTHPQFKAAKQFNKDYVHAPKAAKFNASAAGYPAQGYFSNAGRNSINNGYPTRGNSRVAGSISLSSGPQAKTRVTSAMRAKYPGIFGSKAY
jgi:hypothetical protein